MRAFRIQRGVVFGAAAAAVFAAGSHLGADTYPRQPGIDARHYVVRLTLLTSDSNEIQAEATVTLRVVTAGTREAVLDLTSRDAGRQGDDGDEHHVGRTRRCRSRTATIGCICRCPPGSTAGQDVTFTIAYHGVPADGLRLLNNIHGDRTAFSENWYNRARQWLPMIDHPADKATGELIVTTKADYQVVSNGVIVEQLDLPGGLRRTHWKQDVPISSWLYSLGVARFIVRQGGIVRGVPLSVLGVSAGRRQRAGGARAGRARVVRILLGSRRPVRVRQARARRSRGHGRRHGAREQHLLRREERHRRQRAGGPRNRASVVRRCRHRERLERRVAERRLRDLLHAALHRVRRRPRRVRRRPPAQPQRRAATREVAAEHAGRARQPR